MKITYIVVKLEHVDDYTARECAESVLLGPADDNHYQDISRAIAVVPVDQDAAERLALSDHIAAEVEMA